MKLSVENRVNIVEQYVRNEIGISRAAQEKGDPLDQSFLSYDL